MTSNNLCNSCLNYGCEFQSGIVRTKCAFYMPPIKIDLAVEECKELMTDNTHFPNCGAIITGNACEDAIDRQALRARFNHLDEVYEGMSEEEKHEAYIYGQIIRAIDDAPPITLKNQKTMKSVLDEIRAEIENHCGLVKENHCKYCSYCHNVMGVREILEVIDKYKEGDKE